MTMRLLSRTPDDGNNQLLGPCSNLRRSEAMAEGHGWAEGVTSSVPRLQALIAA